MSQLNRTNSISSINLNQSLDSDQGDPKSPSFNSHSNQVKVNRVRMESLHSREHRRLDHSSKKKKVLIRNNDSEDLFKKQLQFLIMPQKLLKTKGTESKDQKPRRRSSIIYLQPPVEPNSRAIQSRPQNFAI